MTGKKDVPPPRWVTDNFIRPESVRTSTVSRQCTLELGETSSRLRQALLADAQTAPRTGEDIVSITIVYSPHTS